MKTLNKATDGKWILLVLAGLCSLPAHPGLWSIAGLFIGANIVGLLSAIGAAVDHLSFFWIVAISSSVASLWLVGRYRYVAHLRGWKSLGSQFAPVPGKAILLSIALSVALILFLNC